MIREAFDYEFIPQCVFVKDGTPYYVGWDVLGTNLIQEFMVRYEELAQEGIPYLMPAPSAISIYPQHYLKHIGVGLNFFERWLAVDGKNLYIHLSGDIDLVNWPRDSIEKFAKLFFIPIAKQKAMNFLKYIAAPGIVILLVLIYLLRACCRCLCCPAKAVEQEATAMDQEVESEQPAVETKKQR